SCCYKLFAHRHGKRKVSLSVAMQVSNFMTIDAKLDSPKTMREFFNVWPTHDLVFYQLGNAGHDALLIIDHSLQLSSNENKDDPKSISFLHQGAFRRIMGSQSKDILHFSNK